MRKRLSNFLEDSRPLSTAGIMYIMVMCLDWVSTTMCMTVQGLHEANPLVRDENRQFLFHKALIVDFLFIFIGIMCLIALYECLYKLSHKTKLWLCSLPIWYIAYDRLTTAVLNNFALYIQYHK